MSDRLFVSTRKGLFELRRGPSGWNIAEVWFRGDSVSMSLFDARDGALYAALGLGHFGVKMRKSKDGGKTWDEIGKPAFPKQPEGEESKLPDGRPWPWRVEQVWSLEPGLANEPGVLWCGTIGGALFRSADGGATWEFNSALWDHEKRKAWFGGGADMPGIHSIVIDPRDGNSVLVGVSCGGAWRTRDGGKSWEVSSHGMFAEYMPPERRNDPFIQDPHRIVQSPSNPDRLWTQHHNGVFRSDDGGKSWIEIPNVKPSVFGFAVAVHPKQPDTAWLVPAVKDEERVPAEGKLVVSRTRDAGKTWEVLRSGLPQEHAYDIVFRHALDVDDTGERLAFGTTTGSLFVTENGGDAWTSISNHLPPIYAVRFA